MLGRVILLTSVGFLAATCLAEASTAAVLDAVSGRVLVDKGEGFAVVAGKVEVQNDTRILVTADAKAKLSYAGGCKQTLIPNTITTVSSATACREEAQVAGQAAGGAAGGAMGAVGGTIAAVSFVAAVTGVVANELAASP